MKTMQVTLDEELLKQVDRVAGELKLSRSGFTREALEAALDYHLIKQKERAHRKGYTRHPVAESEFSVWEDEQAWGDE